MGRLLAVAIWVITIASVLMFFNKRWWFPEAITDHGPSVDRQFLITIIVCGIAFAAAQIGLGWVVWKYRDSADKARATYSHGNNRLEVVWTIVTAIVFISLGVMGQRVWAALHLNPAPAGSTQIEVTAQQFAWNIRYAGSDKTFGRTDVQFIDDATNPVGLVDTDAGAKDDIVRSDARNSREPSRRTNPEIKRRDAQLLGAAAQVQTGSRPRHGDSRPLHR